MIRLRSYKIRFFDGHVRAVPKTGLDGCAFSGPGVDLRGDAAARVIAAAAPVVAWLHAREPDAVVRSLSVDCDALRVLVTLEDRPRPRVLRFDPPSASDLLEAARDAEVVLAEGVARALARRPPRKSTD